MNKRLSWLIVALLAAILVVAGCSDGGKETNKGNSGNGTTTKTPANNSDSKGKSDAGGGESTSNLTAPGEFPIVNDPVELTVLVRGDARIEDMATNSFTKWYEEKTNVKINWEIAPEGSIPETLNLRLASGDYPDIFLDMGVTRAQEMIYGQQEAFLPLNDLIEEQGFYLKQMFEQRPQYYDGIVTPDGNIYSIPEVNECYHCSLAVRMWVNNQFLDAVGMDIPEDTEQFYQMLKAFKEQDPNGNGLADEIPLMGAINPGAWNAEVWIFLMNSFVYSPPDRLYLQDGEVKASFNQEGWKEGLKYLHRLYSEGLLAGESFTQDGQQLRQLGENPDVAIVGAFPAGWFGVGTEYGGASERWKDYATSIPPLKGPDGTRLSVSFPYQYSTGKAVIAADTKHPEVALRWLDGFFEYEVGIRTNQGEPGIDWEDAPAGMPGIDGRPAKRVAISNYSTVSKTQWYQKAPTFTSDDVRLEMGAGDVPEENLEVILFNQSNSNYEPYRAPLEMVIPPLYFTEDQSMELADLQKTIKDYVDQMTARFVTGDLGIDAEWDNYISTLDNMNLARFLEINQDAYDAAR